MKHKVTYRRSFPHIQPENGVFAITMCLLGTLPRFKIDELKDERILKIAEVKRALLLPEEEKVALIKAHQI